MKNEGKKLHKTIIILGVFEAILPFLGIPYLAKQIIFGLCGLALIFIGLRLWRAGVTPHV